jgi:hypothetical protein
MMLKNLKDNAKNLAANAKIEDMGRLFKNHMAGKQDVKNALSGVMVSQSRSWPSTAAVYHLSKYQLRKEYFNFALFLKYLKLMKSFHVIITENIKFIDNFFFVFYPIKIHKLYA